MRRLRHAVAALAPAACLALSGVALSAPPLVTVRVTSIDAALRDFEAVAKSAHSPITRAALLEQIARAFGVQDLSFLDLSRPAALAMPQEGTMSGANGYVLAVPVRDGVHALEVLSQQFPEHDLDGDLTVLRGAPAESPVAGMMRDTLYAAVHGRVLVLGRMPELVRKFDHASALSGDGLPPGSLAVSIEIEPVSAMLIGGLSAARQALMEMPFGAAPPGPAAPMGAEGGAGSPTASAGPDAEGAATGRVPGADAQRGPARAAPGAGADAPVLVIGDVTPPELIVKVQPDYPEAARRERIQGKVILEAIINRSGEVENVRVLRSIPALDQAAAEAVKRWKYKPATQHGRPVRVFFNVVVDFTLRDSADSIASSAGPGHADEAAAPAATAAPLPFDPRQLAGFIGLYFGLLEDTINSVSKLQVSLEVKDGFLTVHGRGVARQGSALAGFIDAQRDVGMPAIGGMMPVEASVIVAGQLEWTEPSRAWLKRFMQRYESAMTDFVKLMPEPEREKSGTLLLGASLWSSDRIIDCQRGDTAFAMDVAPGGALRALQVTGVSESERCRGALASVVAGLKSGSNGKALVDTEILEPEKVTTYVHRLHVPKTAAASDAPEDLEIRIAQIGDMIVSGTDPWASKAIREAAGRPAGSPPGGGGLVLADLGPFTQRPGVFGRLQVGTLMRKGYAAEKEREERRASLGEGRPGASHPGPAARPETPEALLQALEGPAGAVPFAMRFDDGAATLEFALPLGLFEAFASHAPKPAPPVPPADNLPPSSAPR